jgi:hypothetical protein
MSDDTGIPTQAEAKAKLEELYAQRLHGGIVADRWQEWILSRLPDPPDPLPAMETFAQILQNELNRGTSVVDAFSFVFTQMGPWLRERPAAPAKTETEEIVATLCDHLRVSRGDLLNHVLGMGVLLEAGPAARELSNAG